MTAEEAENESKTYYFMLECFDKPVASMFPLLRTGGDFKNER